MYSVGGAFSDYLLRSYGVEKFLQLYFSCRPHTFEADCSRIYGVDFDDMEKAFWRDAERISSNRQR